jgi:peptidoglycan/LPS O-acetylase OafA/YrhL
MATADSKHRFAELDALRGIAALMVVLYHYTTKYQELYGHTGATLIDLRAGRNGVQLFFAISGFVIFMTLERTKKPLDFIVHQHIGYVIIRNLEMRGVNPNVAILVAMAVVLSLAVVVTTLIERPAMAWVRERYSHRLRAQSSERADMSVTARPAPLVSGDR